VLLRQVCSYGGGGFIGGGVVVACDSILKGLEHVEARMASFPQQEEYQ
jgi:hypothetical protein